MLHVIDFDIGFGGQNASLLKEISERSESCNSPAPFGRVTAVVAEGFARLIKENLTQYANQVNVRVPINFVLVWTFEMTSFKAIKFVDGEVLAVHLVPHRIRTPRLDEQRSEVHERCQEVVACGGRIRGQRAVGRRLGWWLGPPRSTPWSTTWRRCSSPLIPQLAVAETALTGVRKIEGCLMKPRIKAALEWAAGDGCDAVEGGSSTWGERTGGLSCCAGTRDPLVSTSAWIF